MYKKTPLNLEANNYLRIYYCIINEMVRGMTEVELDDSISSNCIVQLLPHSNAAAEMSKNILNYTANPEIIATARTIIKDSGTNVAAMEAAKKACGKASDTPFALRRYQHDADGICERMFSNMRAARADNNIVCDYLSGMLAHHTGGIEFAENVLKYELCSELKPIMRSMISSYRQQVRQIRQMQKSMGC